MARTKKNTFTPTKTRKVRKDKGQPRKKASDAPAAPMKSKRQSQASKAKDGQVERQKVIPKKYREVLDQPVYHTGCGCGCGEETSEGKNFLTGHDGKLIRKCHAVARHDVDVKVIPKHMREFVVEWDHLSKEDKASLKQKFAA